MQLALGKDGKGLALQWQRKGVVMGVEFAHLCCALLCAAVHCCVASGHTEGHLAEANEESGAVARRDLRCHIAGLCAVRRGGAPRARGMSSRKRGRVHAAPFGHMGAFLLGAFVRIVTAYNVLSARDVPGV